MGFCGCDKWNNYSLPVDSDYKSNITRVITWIDHLKRLGVNAVYFSPIFQSDKHGYDTRDYYTVDYRLGRNEDFAKVCDELHKNGIRVVLDGVFNHVGRGFWAFNDVQRNRQGSAYKDWFYIDWNRNSSNNDSFWYEGWEGHYDLVKLNLHNQQVREHLFGAIRKWIDLFHIDGLRLDVAYCLDEDFLKSLRSFCNEQCDGLSHTKGEFLLLGEIIYSNDLKRVNNEMLYSATNYEIYKGLYSSIQSNNMFEISYSLNRLFGQGGILKDSHLFSFVDNHDVERIASLLGGEKYLPIIYGMLFSIPGVPCVYYGSEFSCKGKKSDGDDCLRPFIQNPQWNSLTDFISRLSQIHKNYSALSYGNYENVHINNKQLIYKRSNTCPFSGKKSTVYVAINLDDKEMEVKTNLNGNMKNIFTNENVYFNGKINLPAVSFQMFEECHQ